MEQYELSSRTIWRDLPLCALPCVHNASTTPPDHSHAFYELVLVREGRALHFMNDEELAIRAGNVFLIPPGRIHGYRKAKDLEICNLLFSEEIMETVRCDLFSSPNCQLLFHLQPELRDGMRAKMEILSLGGKTS